MVCWRWGWPLPVISQGLALAWGMAKQRGRLWLGALGLVCAWLVLPVAAQQTQTPHINVVDLRTWLECVAGDGTQGREVFQEGLATTAAYLAEQLKALGVEPAGDNGTYYQTVKVLGIRNTGVSTMTVTVNGESRTFRDGEGVRFRKYQGRARVVTGAAEFVGYGLEFAPINHHDYQGRNVAGKVVILLGDGPQSLVDRDRRILFYRENMATNDRKAAAAIRLAGPGEMSGLTRRGDGERPDFEAAGNYDIDRAPAVTVDDNVLAFVFRAAGVDFATIKSASGRREALPRVNLGDVQIQFDLRPTYEVVQTRLTRNVVARVGGTDAMLRDSYLLFSAHYDHLGYVERQGDVLPNVDDFCPGQARPPARPGDIIYNGADDDGSGTVTVLALAKAFARTPPKRSVLFVWHAGEEAGLYGSLYMADHLVAPSASVAADLNIDMVGRNRCDDPAEADSLFLIGSDRISTELHQISEAANRAQTRPMTLDFTMNSPADLEQLYTRSDHYSYAAKGIPVIFFTTGLHRDYHALTDETSKIEFEKMARVAEVVYETGWRVANLDHLPVRDNQGPRAITRLPQPAR